MPQWIQDLRDMPMKLKVKESTLNQCAFEKNPVFHALNIWFSHPKNLFFESLVKLRRFYFFSDSPYSRIIYITQSLALLYKVNKKLEKSCPFDVSFSFSLRIKIWNIKTSIYDNTSARWAFSLTIAGSKRPRFTRPVRPCNSLICISFSPSGSLVCLTLNWVDVLGEAPTLR